MSAFAIPQIMSQTRDNLFAAGSLNQSSTTPPAPEPPAPRGDIGAYRAVCPNKKENIIVIGSENHYRSFWLKMMFMACGFSNAMGVRNPTAYTDADRTTIIYVDEGYERSELLVLDYLRDYLDINVVKCISKSIFTNYLKTRDIDGERYDIKNLVIYSHGLPSRISLNYRGRSIDLYEPDFTSLPNDLFCKSGTIYSYACRTAIKLGKPLASHFGVPVRAFYRRTFYGNVLRPASESSAISKALVTARETQEGQIIDILESYEGLPHPGLGSGFWGLYGASAEGTDDYALWRKQGALSLPEEDSTPADQPSGFAVFYP